MLKFIGELNLHNQQYVPRGEGLLVIQVDSNFCEVVKQELKKIQSQSGQKKYSFTGKLPQNLKTDRQNRFVWAIYGLMEEIYKGVRLIVEIERDELELFELVIMPQIIQDSLYIHMVQDSTGRVGTR